MDHLKVFTDFFFILQYCFCCVFWFSDYEMGDLASLPEIELSHPAVEDKVLTTREPGSPWAYMLNAWAWDG